jgi:nuclear pore complex protein Nup155
MFSLGPNGDTLVLKSTLKTIHADVNRLSQSDKFSLVGLHVIRRHVRPNDTHDQPQLMAVTSTGARLYFSKYRYMMGMDPDTLQLVHVRLPPHNLRHPPADPGSPYRGTGYLPPVTPANAAAFAVGRIEGSCYAAGITLERQFPGDDPEKSDYVVCIAPDLATLSSLGPVPAPSTYSTPYSSFPSSHPSSRTVLTEYATVMSIAGNAWDMCEVPSISSSIKPPDSPAPVATNELVTQFSEPQRKFLVITNMGLNLIVKRRAIDFLSASLLEADMGNQSGLQDFFTRCVFLCFVDYNVTHYLSHTALAGIRHVQCSLLSRPETPSYPLMLGNLPQLLSPIMQKACYSAKAESPLSRNQAMEAVRCRSSERTDISPEYR